MEALQKFLSNNAEGDILDEVYNAFSSPDIQNEMASVLKSFMQPKMAPKPSPSPTSSSSSQTEMSGSMHANSPETIKYAETFSEVLEYIKTLESRETSWKGVVKQIQLENNDLRKKITELETANDNAREKDESLRHLQLENEKLRNAIEVLMNRAASFGAV